MTLEDFKAEMGAWQDVWLAAIERCKSTKELKALEVMFRKEKRELLAELWPKEGKSKNTRESGRGILTNNRPGPIFPASP